MARRARITGDFIDLEALLKDVKGLADSQRRKVINVAASDAALKMIDRGFEEQVAPGGTPWRPSIRVQMRGGKTLQDTGALRRSFGAYVTSRRFEIRLSGSAPSVRYARVHQYGKTIRAKRAPFLRFRLANGRVIQKKSVYIPPRRMLPVGGIPARWLNEMDKTTGRALKRMMIKWS